MTFTPVLPLGGVAGWGFLKRTLATQKTAFEAAPTLKRDEAYFREKIGTIKTADALVSDKRLLRVALTAFGLEGDVNNTAFIRKVLDDGTLTDGALANRLANKQYQAFSAAFGFGDFAVPRTQLSDFADKILPAFKARQFETAVGAQNSDLRLAMNAERELASLATRTINDDTKWFTIMGNAPLRQVFEKALGLPSSFASIDLDQQLTGFKEKTERLMGSDVVSQFSDPANVEKLLRQFLIRSEISSGLAASSRGAVALQLLRS